jgi:hypothetical protein
MSASSAAWQSLMKGPITQEAGPMKNEFTLDPGLDSPVDRRALGAYLQVTAERTKGQGSATAELVASCVDALGRKIADSASGPVTMKTGRLSAAERMVVRRVLWSANDRAQSGLADASLATKQGMAAVLGGWESNIGYDPEPSWAGRRNQWNEPDTSPNRMFPSARDRGWVTR